MARNVSATIKSVPRGDVGTTDMMQIRRLHTGELRFSIDTHRTSCSLYDIQLHRFKL